MKKNKIGSMMSNLTSSLLIYARRVTTLIAFLESLIAGFPSVRATEEPVTYCILCADNAKRLPSDCATLLNGSGIRYVISADFERREEFKASRWKPFDETTRCLVLIMSEYLLSLEKETSKVFRDYGLIQGKFSVSPEGVGITLLLLVDLPLGVPDFRKGRKRMPQAKVRYYYLWSIFTALLQSILLTMATILLRFLYLSHFHGEIEGLLSGILKFVHK